MSLSVARARVKEKCGIVGTTYDAAIDNLIAELVPVVEYRIRSEYLADVGNAALQATLNLGATELVCAELLEQIDREPGALESVSVEGFALRTVRSPSRSLRARANRRLAPFCKLDVANALGGVAAAGLRIQEADN